MVVGGSCGGWDREWWCVAWCQDADAGAEAVGVKALASTGVDIKCVSLWRTRRVQAVAAPGAGSGQAAAAGAGRIASCYLAHRRWAINVVGVFGARVVTYAGSRSHRRGL